LVVIRNEFLDRELFLHIEELRYVVDRWRKDYNHYRPHASIETTMKYYVGFRESMMDRARQASSAAIGEKSWCKLVQEPKKMQNTKEKELASAIQTLIKAGVTKLGATGLEPATS
jgi:hypothetical protein